MEIFWIFIAIYRSINVSQLSNYAFNSYLNVLITFNLIKKNKQYTVYKMAIYIWFILTFLLRILCIHLSPTTIFSTEILFKGKSAYRVKILE